MRYPSEALEYETVLYGKEMENQIGQLLSKRQMPVTAVLKARNIWHHLTRDDRFSLHLHRVCSSNRREQWSLERP
jgi:hypothetical protein